MRATDKGHVYDLACLDGRPGQTVELRHVKRVGDGYPGNEPPSHAGTTTQEVLRAEIDRLWYVNNQDPCAENEASIGLLQTTILLLEIRAKRRHREALNAETVQEVMEAPTCPKCGHVFCTRHAD